MSCFSHDSNARNDARLLRLRMEHGPAGYGIYCMLLEMLAERAALTTDYAAIAFDLHVDAGLVRSVVEDYGLFEIDGATFFSAPIRQQVEHQETVRRKRSEAGRRGGRPRASAAFRPAGGAIADFLGPFQQENLCMRFHLSPSDLAARYDNFVLECNGRNIEHPHKQDAIDHFTNWLRKVSEAEKQSKNEQAERTRMENRRRGVQADPAPAEGYSGAF